MNKKLSDKSNKIALFIIIIIALFITIVGIEIITIQVSQKLTTETKQPIYNSFRHYEIDDERFMEITPSNNELNIKDKCLDGCNLKFNSNGKTYYYMILKNKEGYRLNVILNNQIILYDKYLGFNIDKSYFRLYLGYTLFYNEIDTEYFLYDYAVVVNDSTHVDEFSSLYNNEFELTDDGIIYYYDVCADATSGGAQKVKAIRKPFTVNPKILNVEYLELSWC